MKPTIIEERLAALEELELSAGCHEGLDPSDGMCIMEAVAWITGEEWSDQPDCASPVIGAFLRAWNDALPGHERQQLKRYAVRLAGSTGSGEEEERRSWMVLDWLVRVHTPAWLRLAGLTDQADLLAGLDEVTSGTCPSIMAPLQAVRTDAAAAGDAARAAVRAATWAAAGDATWAAAGDATWAAARDAARDAAWAAAWAAARDAAWAALAPTVTELQASAHHLVDRMLAVTEEEVK